MTGRPAGATRLALAVALAAWCGGSALAGRDEIEDDEVVTLYPSLGWWAPGVGWEVEVHGRVTEPERRVLSVGALRAALGIADVELTEDEERIFGERARLFLADSERGKRVRVEVAGQSVVMPGTDEAGHFRGRVRLSPSQGAVLPQPHVGGEIEVVARAEDGRSFGGTIVLVPPEGTSVVSDIDDTIKVTEVRDREALLRNTLCRPFRAVPGMAQWYRMNERGGWLVHYLSGSPWQLHDPLARFIEVEGFPRGTFHLRMFRLTDRTALGIFDTPDAQKLAVLEELVARYPRRRFYLHGDSGERDPEIYGELARRHADSVAGVFIRDVTGEPREAERYRAAFLGVPPAKWGVDALDPISRVRTMTMEQLDCGH